MGLLKNQADFLGWIDQPPITQSKDYFENNYYSVGGDLFLVKDVTLTGLHLESKNFESTDFENCVFNDCNLYGAGENQSASDTDHGAAYLISLIMVAEDWRDQDTEKKFFQLKRLMAWLVHTWQTILKTLTKHQ